MIPSGHVRSIDPTYVKVLMVCRAVVTDEAICDITKSEYYVIRLSVSSPAVGRKYHHHFYHLTAPDGRDYPQAGENIWLENPISSLINICNKT